MALQLLSPTIFYIYVAYVQTQDINYISSEDIVVVFYFLVDIFASPRIQRELALP